MRGLVACALIAGCAVEAPPRAARTELGGDSPLVAMFSQVGREAGVSPALLAAIAYERTRLRADDHGLYAVTELRGLDALAETRAVAARLAGADVRTVFGEPLAREVDAALARGIDAHDEGGRAVIVAAQGAAARTPDAIALTLGYPLAHWVPASTSNYQVAARGVGDIDHIVIHDTEGSFDGSVSWFQDPAAQVSAHYIARSADGLIDQMVEEQNIAWHDKCFNDTTIGIEHEGFMAHPELWYTEAMYAASAKLTAYLCDKYGIAKMHGPIIGHGEAPDCSDHTDPGPGWDWDHYIELVQTGGAPMFAGGAPVVDAPASLVSGETARVTVRIENDGNAAWDLDATRVGTQEPADRDSALFVDGDWLAPNRATGLDAPVAPGQDGVFAFAILAPEVTAPTVYDEVFQLVEDGMPEVGWFGPEFHVTVQVLPRDAGSDDGGGGGGCAAAGPGGASTCVMLLVGVPLARRRRRVVR